MDNLEKFIERYDFDSVKINQYLSDDIDILKKYYTIVLKYVTKLEHKNQKLKDENEHLKEMIELAKVCDTTQE